MCSDESICAVMKGCLCSDKKGYSEILLFWKNRSFISESPAFGIEMCSDEFSLKHALTSLSATVPSKKQISGIGAFISESPAFGIEMCSDEFSLKHALTSLSATVPSKKQISGIGECSLIGVASSSNCLSVCFALSCFFSKLSNDSLS